jgi:hypothetical protein
MPRTPNAAAISGSASTSTKPTLGLEHAAWRTPRCPEIEEYGRRSLNDLAVEVFTRDVERVRSIRHGDSLSDRSVASRARRSVRTRAGPDSEPDWEPREGRGERASVADGSTQRGTSNRFRPITHPPHLESLATLPAIGTFFDPPPLGGRDSKHAPRESAMSNTERVIRTSEFRSSATALTGDRKAARNDWITNREERLEQP